MMYVGIVCSSLVLLCSGCRCRHSRGGDAVELCRHDEVVFVQSFDFLGSQRDCRVTPTKADVGMVPLGFGERRRLRYKGGGLAEVSEPIGPLDPFCVIEQLPFRRLRAV